MSDTAAGLRVKVTADITVEITDPAAFVIDGAPTDSSPEWKGAYATLVEDAPIPLTMLFAGIDEGPDIDDFRYLIGHPAVSSLSAYAMKRSGEQLDNFIVTALRQIAHKELLDDADSV